VGLDALAQLSCFYFAYCGAPKSAGP